MELAYLIIAFLLGMLARPAFDRFLARILNVLIRLGL